VLSDDTVEEATAAGALAVLVDGPLPAGAFSLDVPAGVPVVGLESGLVREIRGLIAAGVPVTVAVGGVDIAEREGGGSIAAFSSRGLAFDGGLKPDLAAPGVSVPTSEPGRGDEGEGVAVLLRALAPVAGLDAMRAVRPRARRDRDLCSGPAKLCQALGLGRAFDGADLVTGDRGVVVCDDGTPPPADPAQTTRVGLSNGAEHPWRWHVRGDPNVSRSRASGAARPEVMSSGTGGRSGASGVGG